MARYSIEDTILTDIADVIRDKTNNWVEVEGVRLVDDVRVCHTENASDFYDCDKDMLLYQPPSQVVTIEGAVKIKLDVVYCTAGCYGAYVRISPGTTADSTYPQLISDDPVREEIIFEGTDSAFLRLYGTGNLYGAYFYAEVIGYDADGNTIKKEAPAREPTATYTPETMAATLEDLGKLKFAHINVGTVSKLPITIDLSEYIGTKDDKPFAFVWTGYSSYSTSTGSYGYTFNIIYDGTTFSIKGSNIHSVYSSDSKYTGIANYLNCSLSQGVLTIAETSSYSFYTNMRNSNSQYYMPLFYAE